MKKKIIIHEYLNESADLLFLFNIAGTRTKFWRNLAFHTREHNSPKYK